MSDMSSVGRRSFESMSRQSLVSPLHGWIRSGWGALARLLGIGGASRDLELPDERAGWGWLPAIGLTTGFSLLAIGVCDGAARANLHWAETAFWIAIAGLYFPIAFRLVWPKVGERERIGLVLLLGAALYVVKVLASPLGFTLFDEFLHWATAAQIMDEHRLFGMNPLLPASPFYPGLELVTTALAELSGIPIFPCGLLTIGLARIVFVSAVYLFFRRISGSSRVAAIAVLIYTEADFVFFAAQFAYESLALAFVGLALTADAFAEHLSASRPRSANAVTDLDGASVPPMIATALFLLAAAVTHHLTSYFLAAFFCAIALFTAMRPVCAGGRTRAAAIAVIAVCVSVGWNAVANNEVSNYILPILKSGMSEVWQLVVGGSGSRTLFVSDSGDIAPLWKRAVMLSTVMLTLIGLAFGFFRALRPLDLSGIVGTTGRRTRRRLDWIRPALVTLVTTLYPAFLALRLTRSGWEIANRSTAFVYIGISFVLAVGIASFWQRRSMSVWRAGIVAATVTLMFVGGMLSSCCSVLPGPYAVAADSYSIEAIGIGAAEWSRANLGSGNRILADRINRVLQATYGGQVAVTSLADKLDFSPLILGRRPSEDQYDLLKQARVDYVLMDERLSTGKPIFGVYLERGEMPEYDRAPPDLDALRKFDRMVDVDRVFDCGPIAIYDVRRLHAR
jgi:hypothetical protein